MVALQMLSYNHLRGSHRHPVIGRHPTSTPQLVDPEPITPNREKLIHKGHRPHDSPLIAAGPHLVDPSNHPFSARFTF